MVFYLFILFAAFSAFNLAIYFVVRSLREKQSVFFAAASLLLSFALLIYTLEVSRFILDYPHLIWVHAPLLFAIGPFYFFSASHRARKLWWGHLLPAFAMLIWIGPFYFQSGAEKLNTFVAVQSQTASVQILSYLYLLHIGIYCFLSVKKLSTKLGKTSTASVKRMFWLKIQLMRFMAVICVFSFFACFFLDLNQQYTLDLRKFTLILLIGFLVASQLFLSFTVYGENAKLITTVLQKDGTATLSKEPFNDFNRRVFEEKCFLSSELSLDVLAKELNCSKHELSAYINQKYQQSFSQFINQLRIQEFQERIRLPENKKYTIFAIAKECGFSSNSSFHRVFKNQIGKTPKQFQSEIALSG